MTCAAAGGLFAVVACTKSSSFLPPDDDAGPAPQDEAGQDVAPADHATGDTAPACDLPGSYGNPTCMGCVAARCCDGITACEADPACKPLEKCALDCAPDPDAGGCLEGCLRDHPDGKPKWSEVYDCWFGTPPGGCLTDCT